MYKETRAVVKTDTGQTNWIDMQVSVKQGCPMSPILFTVFMSTLGERLIEKGKGIKIAGLNIPALFFADDFVLMAGNENDMKGLLEELVTFTKEWKLEINQDKSDYENKDNR